MPNYYLLWASGEDRPGIVAMVTEILFKNKCNLEDSSMMRLGSEFGILLIFTSRGEPNKKYFETMIKRVSNYGLNVGLKKISKKQAQFKPIKYFPFIITIHGFDQPGLVYKISSILAQSHFNITDLTTHRTTQGSRVGYIIFIEGELSGKSTFLKLKKNLKALEKKLKIKATVQSLISDAL